MKFKSIFFISFLCTTRCFSQIIPLVTSSVDTSKDDIKEIYTTYTKYLNSRPDSAYNNPYWIEDEKPIITEDFKMPSDRFFWANWWYWKYFVKDKFTVIDINKLYNSDTYSIRTLINDTTENAHWNGRLFDPVFITIYYVKKTPNGWKLENAMTEETKNWKHYNTKYIHYIFPPEFNFQNDLADKADSFCTALLDTFGISHKPFDYYLTTGINQMGRLFNMDYWGSSPCYGYSLFYANQIVSARANEYHIHEFVHILLPRSKNSMIEEGKATFFGGPGSTTFKEALIQFSNEIKNNDSITFSDIYNWKYIHINNSDPFYVTGAVVCKFVYDKKGIEGLKELINCPGNTEDDFYKTVLPLLTIDKKTFDKKIIAYIKSYSTDH